MSKKKEIDYLKAFAIFLVVFYHAVYAAKLFEGNMTYIRLVITLEHVHVPLFILIAGYLCHKQDILIFYRKKVFRILIPFLFMSVLKLLYNNLISSEPLHEGSLGEQIFDAFICGNTYWFCYCLVILFALAPLLWEHRRRIWAALIVFTAANILIQWNETELTDILQIQQVIYQMPFFLIGMLLWSYRIFDQIRKGKAQYIMLLFSLCILGICGYLRLYLDIYNRYYVDALFGLSIMYILYFIAVRIKGTVTDRVLGCMGKYSLQIMFFDSFYRMVIYWLVYQFLDKGIIAALIVTVLDIAISCATCILIRRIPVLSRLCGL